MKQRLRLMLLLAVTSWSSSVPAVDGTPSIRQLTEQAVYAEQVEGNREKAIDLYLQITRRHKANAVSVSKARQQLMRLRSARQSNSDSSLNDRSIPLERASKLLTQSSNHRVSIEDWGETIELVRKYNGGSTDSISDASIKSFVASLDEYSGYLDPETAQDLMSNISGELVGIGVELDFTAGVLTVNSVLDKSPAASAGVKRNDRIVVIDGHTISDFPQSQRLQKSVRLLRGKQGKVVSLGVLPVGATEIATLKIQRDRLLLPTIAGIEAESEYSKYQLPEHPEIGYLHVSDISKQTSEQVREVLKELATLKIKGFVLDLRGCNGGLFSGAVEIADFFLTDGLIVRTEGRERESFKYEADSKESLPGIPMAVLVDGRTASSGEILAGALQQHERAIVVGERTFGKGSIQGLFHLENGGMIKLTTAEFLLAGDVRISKPRDPQNTDRWGIDPSEGMSIDLTDQKRASNDLREFPAADPVLRKATSFLKSQYDASE